MADRQQVRSQKPAQCTPLQQVPLNDEIVQYMLNDSDQGSSNSEDDDNDSSISSSNKESQDNLEVSAHNWSRVSPGKDIHSASESDFMFFGISGLNPDLKDSLDLIEEHSEDNKILKYVEVFITDEMINMLVLFTNIKAENDDNCLHTWRPTDQQEMKKFICLSFLMGILHKPVILVNV